MAAPTDPYIPAHPVPGKPIIKSYPTPNLADRIFVVRKDSRLGGYRLPEKGDPYDGVDAQKMAGFMFATSVPSDQTGWVDHYYLNERANQDDYNGVIEYPYADVNYPRITRTYVYLRGGYVEPTADDVDPVFNGDAGESELPFAPYVLKLVSHQQVPLEDPVLNALFESVQRVYERLPSPVIRTYDQNGVKQIVTIDTQEVETEDVPTSSALTEVLKVERQTTAKAKVTTGTVDEVFPRDLHAKERPDLLPPEFRGLIPNITEGETIEGQAALPTLDAGDIRKSEQQETEFTKRVEETRRDAPVTPVSLQGKEVTQEQQIATVTRTYDDTTQAITGSALVTAGEVTPLGDGTTVKRVVQDPSVFPHKVFETERPDLLPPEFRGQVPTTTTETTSAGTATQPVLTSELRRREEQLTLYRKRVVVTSRSPVTLPKSFFNKELGGLSQGRFGEGFTGVLNVTWTLAAGQQAIDGDFYITDATVHNIGDGTSVKTVKRLDGAWPILRDRIVDDETGIAVNITKKVIVPLTNVFGPIVGGYVDVHSYDKWRSIQITSKVDLSTLPPPEEVGITTDISLPSVLESVHAEWQPEEHYMAAHSHAKFDETDGGSYFDKTNTTQIISQSTIKGTIIVKLRDGYRGAAAGRLVRTYLAGPPGFGAVPSPLLIQPVRGVAYLKGTHYSDTKLVGFGRSERDYQQSSTFDVATIGPCLVGSYIIGNASFNATPVQVNARSKGFLEADSGDTYQGDGTRVADNNVTNLVTYPLQTSVGGAGVLVVDINASTPSSLSSGQEILQSSRAIRWRFGIWIQEVIYVRIP